MTTVCPGQLGVAINDGSPRCSGRKFPDRLQIYKRKKMLNMCSYDIHTALNFQNTRSAKIITWDIDVKM